MRLAIFLQAVFLQPLFLQNDADEPAAAFVDDAGKRFLKLLSGVLGHPLQLGLQVVADQLVEAAPKDIGLPDLAGVPLELQIGRASCRERV